MCIRKLGAKIGVSGECEGNHHHDEITDLRSERAAPVQPYHSLCSFFSFPVCVTCLRRTRQHLQHAQDVSGEQQFAVIIRWPTWNGFWRRPCVLSDCWVLIFVFCLLFSRQFQVLDWFDASRSSWRISFDTQSAVAAGDGFVVARRTQSAEQRQCFVVGTSARHVANQAKPTLGQKVANGHGGCHETRVSCWDILWIYLRLLVLIHVLWNFQSANSNERLYDVHEWKSIEHLFH